MKEESKKRKYTPEEEKFIASRVDLKGEIPEGIKRFWIEWREKNMNSNKKK